MDRKYREISVKYYVRKDGTPVKSHTRKIRSLVNSGYKVDRDPEWLVDPRDNIPFGDLKYGKICNALSPPDAIEKTGIIRWINPLDDSLYMDDHLHPDGGSIQWIEMSPDQFLSIASPKGSERETAYDLSYYRESTFKYFNKVLSEGGNLSIPYLLVDTNSHKVYGHEGRHRALYAKLRGVKRIPVAVRHKWDRDDMVFDARGEKELKPLFKFGDLKPQKFR